MDYPVKTIEQFAPLLKAFRRAAGLTQADLAERLGITQQTYARLEANPQVVSLTRLLRVLAVLNVQMTLETADASAPQPVPQDRETGDTRKGAAATVGRAATKRGSGNPAKRTPARSRTASAGKPAEKPATKPTEKLTEKPAGKPAEKQPRPVISKRERW